MSREINVIDLFAGPGGLGEGFSAFEDKKGNHPFKIRMSVEKEASAHKTLTTRAFSRLFAPEDLPEEYHQHLAGNLTQEELFGKFPSAATHALEETMGAATALGKNNRKIFSRIRELQKKHKGPWIVIGGPPCQAYSLVGRSRNKGIKGYKPEADDRHFLYREYLKVLDEAKPEVFVMENVKGILTAKINGTLIFPSIFEDLKNPRKALGKGAGAEYIIHSFVTQAESDLLEGHDPEHHDFVIRTENYGIPQARHRVILLGIKKGNSKRPRKLEEKPKIHINDVIGNLPKLRSKLSKETDSAEAWIAAITDQSKELCKELSRSGDKELSDYIKKMTSKLRTLNTSVNSYKKQPLRFGKSVDRNLADWLGRNLPRTLLNHESRGHIRGDLGRYLFNAAWTAKNNGASAKAEDFPALLRPAHRNWDSGHFADRFRVQAKGKPSTTITSHISKDGHYYIHYDPLQCRSLTVREAARLQTFPDNYFFEGTRTQQYVQVGNAVPPLLAKQIAFLINDFLN